jgi:hypothetical protein
MTEKEIKQQCKANFKSPFPKLKDATLISELENRTASRPHFTSGVVTEVKISDEREHNVLHHPHLPYR